MHGIRLFVGLGNPGEKYVATRHNAGFWWVDLISQQTNSPLKLDAKMFGETSKMSGQADTWLLKPNTFMNASGKAVAAIANYYKIKPAEILVIHDELDLPVGTSKLKLGGGHGGHNGLRDIHAALGTPDYWRLRVGIGHPGDRNEVVNFVLKPPLKAEQTAIDESLYQSSKLLTLLLAGQFEQAMLTLHTKA
ncbi:peptidyl-tRNA hydrolase [Methylophilaceae bacterium 11]|uniref:aminoacyl-tRNA hydrolase n=1 Tax=Methylotenera sp. N17 TaxID=1502761 RepID=UPI000452AD82|nr:aminoacyl-tRNA hydrolase [Methylotenera sp. N17]EUJ11149.1 peptidyl-tRNA hydrolase [Methylophilaceae bacterium 11]